MTNWPGLTFLNLALILEISAIVSRFDSKRPIWRTDFAWVSKFGSGGSFLEIDEKQLLRAELVRELDRSNNI